MSFVTILKMLELGEFGTYLDDVLRNQMVWSIKDHNIEKPLLSEHII